MQTQYRYSQQGFRRSVATAVGLTAIMSFLVWLFARLAGFADAKIIASVVAILFFSFCSAAMIWRYLRREIVVAIRPDGLFDARRSSQALLWDDIREVKLGRAENEFRLILSVWERSGKAKDVEVDLSGLDADVNVILQAISAYRDVTMEAA
ncbi:hypothetical protein [Ahrensia sp. R2A130]|uniref:hypothetical protein n=1 Tax=Ahrensia sp. R2A130 TaxID=744979 RepID=UPI0001E0C368|nr:hypothetical protein [Ahrensia sp. R2A130]EFL88778.1 hypothetical protein R2A130_1262 [Ahrensia sp. R2A130]